VKRTTIGFEAVKALLAGRVDGATAFWNVEGVAVRARRPQIREFRVDDFGAPAYPELVLCVTRETLEDEPEEVRAVIRALQRGYGETSVDPESGVSAMLERERGLDRDVLASQLDAVGPAFNAGVERFGTLDRPRLEAWSRWDVEFGILKRPVDLDRAFAFGI
jgi:ABC-type nitrate/sulfonate/bicarbonate transport system substrate-binding protein